MEGRVPTTTVGSPSNNTTMTATTTIQIGPLLWTLPREGGEIGGRGVNLRNNLRMSRMEEVRSRYQHAHAYTRIQRRAPRTPPNSPAVDVIPTEEAAATRRIVVIEAPKIKEVPSRDDIRLTAEEEGNTAEVATQTEDIKPAVHALSCLVCQSAFFSQTSSQEETLYFCSDCGPFYYVCFPCLVADHKVCPHHIPQVWNVSFVDF
eukprot:Seg7115.2 transcript_id=Seg7115.2/GoldUCD/mRNA.D3Y31 product="hypothetical protein" protein_id=Seg7115.2/GoldUCD/D3Y31